MSPAASGDHTVEPHRRRGRRLASGGLAAEIERLRAEPAGGDIAIGGATLAHQAAELGLIETRAVGSTVVYLRYRVAR